jgi:hypothetical protein
MKFAQVVTGGAGRKRPLNISIQSPGVRCFAGFNSGSPTVVTALEHFVPSWMRVVHDRVLSFGNHDVLYYDYYNTSTVEVKNFNPGIEKIFQARFQTVLTVKVV